MQLAIVFAAKMALRAQGSVQASPLELLLGLVLPSVDAVVALPESQQLLLEQVGQASEEAAATY